MDQKKDTKGLRSCLTELRAAIRKRDAARLGGALADYRRADRLASRRSARRPVAASPDLSSRRFGIEVGFEHRFLSITIPLSGRSATLPSRACGSPAPRTIRS